MPETRSSLLSGSRALSSCPLCYTNLCLKRKHRARETSKHILTTACSVGNFDHVSAAFMTSVDHKEQDETCEKRHYKFSITFFSTVMVYLRVNCIFSPDPISTSQGYIYISLHGFCCRYSDTYLFSPAFENKMKYEGKKSLYSHWNLYFYAFQGEERIAQMCL